MSGYHRELKLETAINPGRVKEKTIKMPGDLAERLVLGLAKKAKFMLTRPNINFPRTEMPKTKAFKGRSSTM